MKIKIDTNGNLVIGAYDLFRELDDEKKNEIIAQLAWSSPMFEEIKRAVNEEFSSQNFNPDIHELRMAFLKGDDIDHNLRRIIGQLIDKIAQLEKERSVIRQSLYSWENWYHDKYGSFQYPVQTPNNELTWLKSETAQKVFDVLGITEETLNNPIAQNTPAASS